MSDSALPVIKGVIATLQADAAVSSIASSRIYTDVPQGATFPYIVVSVTSEPFASNDFVGQTHNVRVQGFSREATIQQCLQIRKACLDALDRKETAISLDAGTLVKCEYAGLSDAFIEDDGKTWQSVCDLEVVVV